MVYGYGIKVIVLLGLGHSFIRCFVNIFSNLKTRFAPWKFSYFNISHMFRDHFPFFHYTHTHTSVCVCGVCVCVSMDVISINLGLLDENFSVANHSR